MSTSNPTANMKPPSPRLLSHLFASLSSSAGANRPRQWHLRRTLRSDNPADINGELTGIATFHPLHTPSSSSSSSDSDKEKEVREMVYREEGEMPSSSIRGMAGLRWSKKYIWRMNNNILTQNDNEEEEAAASDEGEEVVGGIIISVWFVKIQPGQDEADYLFHEFDFGNNTNSSAAAAATSCGAGDEEDSFIEPPVPPPANNTATETRVIQARGNHLCIKDIYRTAYSFRIVPDTGEVLSWASRHVVKGPKKNQDIINLYS